jgi:hypothetical protein
VPAKLPEEAMKEVKLAIQNAQEVRRYHARQTEKGDPQRQSDLTLAMIRVKAAMKPLKREIGRFPYGPNTDTAEKNRQKIRAASRALQAERRKLWKMLQPPPPEKD